MKSLDLVTLALCAVAQISDLRSQDSSASPQRPNVILIMTDDQGYGDFGVTGNPKLQTPNIDRLAQSSAQLSSFYVCPVCAPTRASLMTGRYHYRTRVVDTWNGRAMMDSSEITIAETLRDSGYATGIFGKWHLGDCYPLRPQDQGFEFSLVHRGGGIGQSSDPVGGERKYTDAVLFENGKRIATKGYCTDVYFRTAMQWIEERDESPFFAYIATNAPHGPFHDVPKALYDKYRSMDLSDERFPQEKGHRLSGKKDLDKRARIYAMIENIDQNVGRLLAKLDQLGIADNTIVVFLTDNGPNGHRYVAGMRGVKCHVHEGGIRSPFFFRWPGHTTADHSVPAIAAHIDVMPTILDACKIKAPAAVRLDGRSMLAQLTGKASEVAKRTIFIQAHRGDVPYPLHHFAARSQDWKLVHPSGFGKESFEGAPKLELYDMRSDPLEQHNVAASNAQVVARLRTEYEAWFHDVSHSRPNNYAPPRIHVGSIHENPSELTRQDWRRFGESSPHRGNRSIGYWLLLVERPGNFRIHMSFPPTGVEEELLVVNFGGKSMKVRLTAGTKSMTFEFHDVPAGPTELETEIMASGNKRHRGVLRAEVTRL